MLIGTIGNIASIIALYVFFKNLSTEGGIAVFFLGVICLYFGIYNFYLIRTYRKKPQYADAFADINIGFSYLHKLRRTENLTVEQILPELEKLCDSVSQAFGRIYGCEIGVCIKILINDSGRPRCETLVRDSHSLSKNRKTGSQDSTKHWIDSNSDFEFIYSNYEDDNVDTSFYLEQHLPNCMDYKNTRLKQGWSHTKKWLYPRHYARKWAWPLPYMSTLIVPIVPLISNDQNQKALRGFLCADSPNEGDFNKYYDVNIMKGVADGVYNQIDLIHQLVQSKSKESSYGE